MSHGTWRDIARSVIQDVVKKHGDLPIPEFRRKLKRAYPFGERAYFPYKVWCEEVRKVLKGKMVVSTMPAEIDGKQLTIFRKEAQP